MVDCNTMPLVWKWEASGAPAAMNTWLNGRKAKVASTAGLLQRFDPGGDPNVVLGCQVLHATLVGIALEDGFISDYQYYWWIDEGRNAYYAQGDHCQYIYVAPATDVVLVRHGHGCGDTDEVDVDWVGLLGGLVEWLGPQLKDG